MPTDLNLILEAALDAAQQASGILKKYWGNLDAIEDKAFKGDLVTRADKEADECIVNILKNKFPAHHFLSEESPVKESFEHDNLWVIDPLDGTTNYTHQFPCVSISIAFVYKGAPVVGVVYNPFYQELFWASKDGGAFLNGTKLKVSKVDQLSNSLLATGFPYDRRENPDNNYKEFCHFTHLTQGVRRGGSAALDLAQVAAGRFDGYWERIKPWDVAAGVILVQEAGGAVTTYDGKPYTISLEKILASNGLIHQQMIHELHHYRN